MKRKLPTDLEILECIYREYSTEFERHSRGQPTRASKIYVPIDVDSIANKLNMDGHELFGRLYYHLDQKYRYTQDDGSHVHLFAFAVGEDRHCINYPYLAGTLAEYQMEDRRRKWSLWISIGSLIVALGVLLARIAG